MPRYPMLYLKGTLNGWGLDTPFQPIDDHLLQASVVFPADKHQFKIADLNGSENWTFAADDIKAVEISLNQTLSLIPTQGIGNDLVFEPEQSGRYLLTLDLSEASPNLHIKPATVHAELQRTQPEFDQIITPQCGSVPAESTTTKSKPVTTLTQNELFQALAIESDTPFSFVFGDNLDGYYEGQTHSVSGSARYRHHQGWYLGGFASCVGSTLNNREQAQLAALMPYGIEHHYTNASKDCLSLMAGQRLVALSVESACSDELSLIPELNVTPLSCQIEAVENCLLISVDPEICPEGALSFIAISANQPVRVQTLSNANTDIHNAVFGTSQNVQLKLSSESQTKRFTTYFAFSNDRAEAIKQAQTAAFEHAALKHQHSVFEFLTNNYFWCDDLEYNRAVMWARLASRTFVNKELGTGIWAGLPWFKDCWGRDTFIALPGTSLVNGEFGEAREIISNFASMQLDDIHNKNHGRIPNRVTSETNIIYNTTDGTPWMVREIFEYINYTGDTQFAHQMLPIVKCFIEGVEKHYLDDDGLMLHRDPDTWMDAKINGQIPWSPRGPKANDIEALWYESLLVAYQLAEWNNDQALSQHCLILADKVKASFIDKFWDGESMQLADHLKQGDAKDTSVRPNQLMTLTIPTSHALVPEHIGQHIVKNSVEHLLFPWGICSLQQEHPEFHPYHDNRSEYHKDAAYHNGTIWGWNAGFTVGALSRYQQQDLAYELSKNLAHQILYQGHRGTMSENLDAYQESQTSLIQSGTYAQAWSVSEFARNTQQDYLGFTPKLSTNTIELCPNLPSAWTNITARLPFSDGNALYVRMEKSDTTTFLFDFEQVKPEIKFILRLRSQRHEVKIEASMSEAMTIEWQPESGQVHCSRGDVKTTLKPLSPFTLLEGLTFTQPNRALSHPALEEDNYLLSKRSSKNLCAAKD
ncbi:glycogen debranching protein [Vibrio albus]|uniref:Glycogen debranching protein n=1 Tax=Vibrio albus TaxID=2200953 RepID=A0A2U3B8T8_9VIBR|nr:amylo-alpha-1,6-glucosidase [Vibrio albus]PWI33198.1 glycogen debranching protein [Vibrio albus]